MRESQLYNFEKEYAFSTNETKLKDEDYKDQALLTFEGKCNYNTKIITFIIDCAATQHFVNDSSMFIELRE